MVKKRAAGRTKRGTRSQVKIEFPAALDTGYVAVGLDAAKKFTAVGKVITTPEAVDLLAVQGADKTKNDFVAGRADYPSELKWDVTSIPSEYGFRTCRVETDYADQFGKKSKGRRAFDLDDFAERKFVGLPSTYTITFSTITPKAGCNNCAYFNTTFTLNFEYDPATPENYRWKAAIPNVCGQNVAILIFVGNTTTTGEVHFRIKPALGAPGTAVHYQNLNWSYADLSPTLTLDTASICDTWDPTVTATAVAFKSKGSTPARARKKK